MSSLLLTFLPRSARWFVYSIRILYSVLIPCVFPWVLSDALCHAGTSVILSYRPRFQTTSITGHAPRSQYAYIKTYSSLLLTHNTANAVADNLHS